MNLHVTAVVRRGEPKKAAPARAAFSDECREHHDTKKIGSAAPGVNANHLLAALSRVGGLQRLARPHPNDPSGSAWWRTWAMHVTNELMAAAPGTHIHYQSETEISARRYERVTTTRTRTKVIRWPRPCAATVLGYGRDAPFQRIGEVPAAILAAVEAGVADALARGRRIRYSGHDIARALSVTLEQRVNARAWQIGACDKTDDEMAEFKRQRRNEQQRRRRRKQGLAPHDDSIAAMARAAGVKPDTMRARLRRARLKAENGAEQHVANLKPRNKKKDREASFSRQRSAAADSVRTCVKSPSQLRHTPGRPKDGSAGVVGGPNVQKTISADAGRIFCEREKDRRPRHDASPTPSAAATDSALASTSLA